MSEMVERATAALMNVAVGEHRLDLANPEECVRAVIEAMREPTGIMSTAGKHAVKGCDSTFERDIAEAAYAVMIDAALSDPMQKGTKT